MFLTLLKNVYIPEEIILITVRVYTTKSGQIQCGTLEGYQILDSILYYGSRLQQRHFEFWASKAPEK